MYRETSPCASLAPQAAANDYHFTRRPIVSTCFSERHISLRDLFATFRALKMCIAMRNKKCIRDNYWGHASLSLNVKLESREQTNVQSY